MAEFILNFLHCVDEGAGIFQSWKDVRDHHQLPPFTRGDLGLREEPKSHH